jgi:hypothetical protein
MFLMPHMCDYTNYCVLMHLDLSDRHIKWFHNRISFRKEMEVSCMGGYNHT